MAKRRKFTCTDCGILNCARRNAEFPKACLTTDEANQGILAESLTLSTENEDNARILQAAAQVEGQYYGRLTRVEEIIVFAKKIGAKKIGIASCMGLIAENKIFAKILQANGLEAYGVLCKIGSLDKTEFGISEDDKICPGSIECGCNPIMQAKLCNREETDLNIISGLCVGHDTLFMRYSEAPVSYLIVKDRVLAHNPVGALNTTQSYYSRILKALDIKD